MLVLDVFCRGRRFLGRFVKDKFVMLQIPELYRGLAYSKNITPFLYILLGDNLFLESCMYNF